MITSPKNAKCVGLPAEGVADPNAECECCGGINYIMAVKTDVRAYVASYLSIQVLGLAVCAPIITSQHRELDLLLLAFFIGGIVTAVPTLLFALLLTPLAKAAVNGRKSTWWLLSFSSIITLVIFQICLTIYDAFYWDETIMVMLGSALLAGGIGVLVAWRVYSQANDPIIYKGR